MSRDLNPIKSNWDWWLITLILCLMILGVVNLYSAAYNPERTFLFDISALYGKQIMWMSIGIFLGIIISLIDSEFIQKLTPAAFAVILFLLIIVLF